MLLTETTNSTVQTLKEWAGNGFNAIMIILLCVVGFIVLIMGLKKLIGYLKGNGSGRGRHRVTAIPTLLSVGAITLLTGETTIPTDPETATKGWAKFSDYCGGNFQAIILIVMIACVVGIIAYLLPKFLRKH